MNENIRLILKNLNLLYVEDNKKLMTEVENVFSSIFDNVITALDGVEAINMVKQHNIDIIITDLDMPNKDGLSFIKEVRSTNKNISIIILTAHADKNLLLEASNLQIDGYLTKPINFTKIMNALSSAVQRMKFALEYKFKSGTIYNMNTKSVVQNNTLIELGKKESKLLELLILNSQKITTKEEIIYHIWELDDITESALKNLISNLRIKIGKENIVNYPGHGWKVNLVQP